jgi:hypothetical protein
MKNINHSGGAKGSDTAWDMIGRRFGFHDHRHYYHGDKTPLGNVLITEEELEEGWKHVLQANKTLRRQPHKYKSLLSRNWFQVKNANAVYAISTLSEDRTQVSGGTGWAVQMAIDNGKRVFVFDQDLERWFEWKTSFFIECETPAITENYAGIGTRQITRKGIEAIENVYRKTLQNGSEKTSN